MSTEDKCCTIAPYFKISQENLGAFKELTERFVAISKEEPGCLYYGYCFDGDEAHCREGYRDAEALLTHVGNVGPLIAESLTISELTRLEVHGPAEELAKLRGPLAQFGPQFFVLENGFRR